MKRSESEVSVEMYWKKRENCANKDTDSNNLMNYCLRGGEHNMVI